MKKMFLIIVLLLNQFSIYSVEKERRIFRTNPHKLKEYKVLKNDEVYEKEHFLNVTLNSKGKKGKLLFSTDSSYNSKLILFNLEDKTQTDLIKIIVDLKIVDTHIDKYSNFVQITCLDLNKDGNNELILSVADTQSASMWSYIWSELEGKYEYIGQIEGQFYTFYDHEDNTINAPYGTVGLFSKYILKDNKIIQTY